MQHDSSELPPRPGPPLTVAVSDCLTGAAVRYDGRDKRSALCHAELDGRLELRGICPEVAIGLGVPRAPIRLVGDPARPSARGVDDASLDVTDRLRAHARAVAATLGDVDGYIFMTNSPSCGLSGVPVVDERGAANGRGRGVFAAEIVALRDDLPVEECGALDEPERRDDFITRVFAHAHWRRLRDVGLTPARLAAFHRAYRCLWLAHDGTGCRAAERSLGDASIDPERRAHDYIRSLMAGLARPATRRGHAKVLSRLEAAIGGAIDAAARRELAAAIDAYRRGAAPLDIPQTLLRRHLRSAGDGSARDRCALAQIYLEPHPPAITAHAAIRPRGETR